MTQTIMSTCQLYWRNVAMKFIEEAVVKSIQSFTNLNGSKKQCLILNFVCNSINTAFCFCSNIQPIQPRTKLKTTARNIINGILITDS